MKITRNRQSVNWLLAKKYNLNGIPRRFMEPVELQTLLSLIDSIKAETVIEFGVNNGRNPLAVFRNLPSVKRYVGIDVDGNYQTIMPVQRNEVPIVPGELVLDDDRFELIIKPRGGFDLSPDDLPAADVVFIDGDHSRAGVENDYWLAREKVRSGGLIIFHDDNCLPVVEVTQTLNDLVDDGREIVHIADTWLSYERVP